MEALQKDYERIVQEVYEALLGEGDVAVDVGAHTGRHTLPMARHVGPRGRVLAFEPLPSCRRTLVQLLQSQAADLVGTVSVHPQALSDTPGTSEFVVAVDDPGYSGLRERTYDRPTRLERIPVAVETLDRLCLHLPGLRFIKVDAEGAELHILRGATECIERFRPVVGFEFGARAIGGYDITPADMADFWVARGYLLLGITGERLSPAEFVRAAEQQDYWDYVAVPAEDRGDCRLVESTLRRARVDWQAAALGLRQAEQFANVGAETPPMSRYRGPLRPIARGMARLVLFLGRIVTRPQREFNVALLRTLFGLVSEMERAGVDAARSADRVRELEERVRHLESRLARLEAPDGAPELPFPRRAV